MHHLPELAAVVGLPVVISVLAGITAEFLVGTAISDLIAALQAYCDRQPVLFLKTLSRLFFTHKSIFFPNIGLNFFLSNSRNIVFLFIKKIFLFPDIGDFRTCKACNMGKI